MTTSTTTTHPVSSPRPTGGAQRAPGLGASATFSVLRGFSRDPLQFLLGLRRDYGDVARFSIGPQEFYLFSHPAAIRHVLVERSDNYTKRTRDYALLKLALGEGMLTSDGEKWRQRRRIANPAFHKARVSGFAEVMVEKTAAMLTSWREVGAPVDVADEMMRLTLRIVAATLFSMDVGDEIARLGRAVAVTNREIFARMTSPFDLPLFFPTPGNLRIRRELGFVDAFVASEVQKRRDSGGVHGDLLDMLLEAKEGPLDARELRDEIVTMFVAGHETTANVLTWCLYLLSTHADVERRVRDELDRVLGGRSATYEDVPRLTYLKQVVSETMRLYPAVWAIGRFVQEEDVVGGFAISKGADVTLSPYVTHRHPDLWHNPEAFDPDRFADPSSIPKFAYFPFSGGARQCIGSAFAMMEAQLILATILSRVRVELVVGHRVAPEPLVTLRPRHGMRMVVRPVSP